MFRRILVSSRFFILIAVVGSLIASVITMVSGMIAVVTSILEVVQTRDVGVKGVKVLAVDILQVVDIFLVGTVLYIMAVGLYELFIDPELSAPHWLKIESLDELKERLVAVVVVMLGVTFLAYVVDLKAGWSILDIGIATAAVLAGLGLFFRLAKSGPA
jgi:uncharacterized membrane protein YqhA